MHDLIREAGLATRRLCRAERRVRNLPRLQALCCAVPMYICIGYFQQISDAVPSAQIGHLMIGDSMSSILSHRYRACI